LLFFTNVENIFLSTKSALLFCASSLVPSIFIFMVLCSTILYTKALEPLFSIMPNSLIRILGTCKKYIPHILLGSLCGFVNGPKAICEDFKKNGGSDVEFSNAIILSSNAGIRFLLGCVGGKIWSNFLFGIYLFLCQIFLSFLLGGLILKRPKFNNSSDKFSKNYCKNSSKKEGAFTSISRAVISSSSTIISICGFIVFFSAICEIFSVIFSIEKGTNFHSILNIFMEFCQGSFYAISFNSLNSCLFFTGFCVRFGGICVHMQTFAVCDGFPLDKIRFFIFKLFHGILCGFSAVLFSFLFEISIPLQNAENAFKELAKTPKVSFFMTFFALCVTVFTFKKIFSKIILIFN
jgi:hypothetical protein